MNADDQVQAPQRRRLLRTALAMAGATALSCRASAPARADALRILCSGPAGSIPDLIARSVGQELPDVLQRRVWVDNRPGAAGQLSVMALKAAPADASTLLLAQGAIATVYPSLYARLPYDAAVDLVPVSLASEMLVALAVGPAVPPSVTTLADFIVWARRQPDPINVGSPGVGTVPHLLQAMLFRDAGVAWQHIAYSGGPPAVTALLGGQIAALALPEGLLRQHHVARTARVLATSGPARSGLLPAVPTFAEQGHARLVIVEWFAFFGRTADAAMSAALAEAIGRPGVAAAFAAAGMTPVSSSPAALAARIAHERRQWQPVLAANDIHAD